MKIHYNLVKATVTALDEIFNEGRYADKVLERLLKSDARWGARDRAFIAENTYDIVRWYRLLNDISGNKSRNHWITFGAWRALQGLFLPEWEEFAGIDEEEIAKNYETVKNKRAVAQSIPSWLDDLGVEELGEKWDDTLKALNETAPVILRANTLRATKKEIAKRLREEYVETEWLADDALAVIKRQNVFLTGAFKAGWFEVQDFSSQQVAHALNVQPGMRVVDACAGAGGKSLHIAALMKNKGKIIALDTEEWKLEELRKRSKRAGVDIIESRPIDSGKAIKRLLGSADRLLLDVPCSGLGVLRRNPDAKWKLDQAFLDKVRGWQEEILENYASIVKPGGEIVYATCSILPSENIKQVEKFLEKHTEEYELISEKQILPQDAGFDGFFIARIKRKIV